MRSRSAAAVAVVLLAAGCGALPPEPLTLEGNLLTVDNRSRETWTDVEIWLNDYYRVTARTIPGGGRFQAPLDTFVESRGGRFNFQRMQVRALRLTATRPDGSPLEITKQFERTGLERLGERR